MITVEELIVQSLYHKLVLVNVKRSGSTPTGGKMDGLGVLITGAQRMRAAMAAQGTLPPGAAGTSASDDLSNEVDDEVPQHQRMPQPVPPAGGAVMKSGSKQVSKQESGQVNISPDLQTILDTGEFQLVKATTSNIEVQTDAPPTWYFGLDSTTGPTSALSDNMPALEGTVLDAEGREVAVKPEGHILSSNESGMPAVDLSSYEQFSIVHYQDLRDPENRSMVMIQTPQQGQQLEKLTDLVREQEQQESITHEEKPMLEAPLHSEQAQCSLMQRSLEGQLFPRDGDLERATNGEEGACGGEKTPRVPDVITVVPRPVATAEQVEVAKVEVAHVDMAHVDVAHMQEAHQQQIDSGIWNIVQGHNSIAEVHREQMPTLESKIDDINFSSVQTPYIPDTDPIMTLKVYKINDELVLSSSGDEKITKPLIEKITERKALSFDNSAAQKKKPKRRGRMKGKVKAKGKKKGRSGKGRESSKPSSPDESITGVSSMGEDSTTSARYTTADEVFEDEEGRLVEMEAGIVLNGGISFRVDRDGSDLTGSSTPQGSTLSDRSFDHDWSWNQLTPRRTSSGRSSPRMETTFTPENTVTYAEDETAIMPIEEQPLSSSPKIVPIPLRKPLKSGVNMGLNLIRGKKDKSKENRKSAPQPKTVYNRYAMTKTSDLASPMSEDTISPSSEDSMFENFLNADSIGGGHMRRNGSPSKGRPRSFTPGMGDIPDMSSFRGPFLSVPKSKLTPSSEDSSDVEYESAEEQAITPVEDITPFYSHADWMSELPRRLHDVPLSLLAIPGSDVSLAIEADMRLDMNFSKCNLEMAEFLRKLPPLAVFDNFRGLMKNIWRSWMSKQILTLPQQLEAGVRYFDLRITKYRGALYGEHGLFTKQLKKYLKEMDAWLREHKKEIILIHFQSFEGIDHKDKRALLTALFQIFGARLCRASRVQKLSLKYLWESRKQVMIIFPDSDVEQLQDHIFIGLVWSCKNLRMSVPKKQKAMDLVRYLDCIYDEERDGESLHVTQAVLSPDLRMVFGDYKYKSMRDMTFRETCPALKQWLLGKKNLNIVAFDYVGIYDLTGAIIALNELKKAETVV